MIPKIYILLNFLISSIFTIHKVKVYTKFLGEKSGVMDLPKVPKFDYNISIVEIRVNVFTEDNKEKEIYKIKEYSGDEIKDMIQLKQIDPLGLGFCNVSKDGTAQIFPFSATVGEEIVYELEAFHLFVSSEDDSFLSPLYKKPSGCPLCVVVYFKTLVFIVNEKMTMETFRKLERIDKIDSNKTKEISLVAKSVLII